MVRCRRCGFIFDLSVFVAGLSPGDRLEAIRYLSDIISFFSGPEFLSKQADREIPRLVLVNCRDHNRETE